MEKTNNTLYVLVSCSFEPTRHNIFREVISNLKEQSQILNFLDDFIIFDNGSIINETRELAKELSNNIWYSPQNIGYWSAISWILNNYEIIFGRQYEYVYIIESDFVHYNMNKIIDCEKLLINNNDILSIRTQKFDVINKHLYDKDKQLQFSNRFEWVRQFNSFQKKNIEFTKLDNNFYRTNFVPKLPGLNKIDILKFIFEKLQKLEFFNEMAFQELFYTAAKELYKLDRYNIVGLLDKGIFHTELSYKKDIISGSFTNENELIKIGYQPTRNGKISREFWGDIRKI